MVIACDFPFPNWWNVDKKILNLFLLNQSVIPFACNTNIEFDRCETLLAFFTSKNFYHFILIGLLLEYKRMQRNCRVFRVILVNCLSLTLTKLRIKSYCRSQFRIFKYECDICRHKVFSIVVHQYTVIWSMLIPLQIFVFDFVCM